ncbi:MAG: 3-deoxy-manno-octulosonate cytidylyltransferase, partial [Gammaproteobacteria bacterium]|nr:3-deoxy-manno-octulosonate cytidylyltransferase [Gammaproteobacteria bacterium]
MRIAEVASGFGAEVCMTSADHPSGTDRLAEVVERQAYADDHVIVNLQGDEPLMPPAVINQVAQNLMKRADVSMATVCKRIKTSRMLFDPHVVKVVSDEQGYALYFSRAAIPWDRERFPMDEDLPEYFTHYAHIGLYAYRCGFLKDYVSWPVCHLEETESLEQLRVLYKGHRIHVEEAVEVPGPGVDIDVDLEEVRMILTP